MSTAVFAKPVTTVRNREGTEPEKQTLLTVPAHDGWKRNYRARNGAGGVGIREFYLLIHQIKHQNN